MHRWMCLALLVAGSGCYSPRDKASCAVRCGSDLQCPNGLTCSAAGELCHGAELDSCNAGTDADVPPGDLAPNCYGSALVTVCQHELPGGVFPPAAVLSGAIDTTQGQCTALLARDNLMLCVVAGINLTVGDIQVSGPNPLVLLAMDQLRIIGAVQAHSSSLTARVGPNANATGCLVSGIDGADGLQGVGEGGGGAGGTFADFAGNGGRSRTVLGGAAATSALGKTVRGGCPGGRGGGSGPSVGGIGGAGGGAVYFIAGTAIAIESTGVVNASGGGGTVLDGPGVPPQTGGGGGGSGGFLGLDAPTITIAVNAQLFALGGGGGAGGGPLVVGTVATGAVGEEPAGPDAPARTVVSPEGCTGSGGAGSSLGMIGANGGDTIGACGGGGGGGGSGLIIHKSDTFDDQGGRFAPGIQPF